MHVCVALMRECFSLCFLKLFLFLVFLSPTIFLLDSGMCACVLHLMSVRLDIDISKRSVIYFVKQSCIKNKTKKMSCRLRFVLVSSGSDDTTV